MDGVLLLPHFIDAGTRNALLRELREAHGAPAPVYGASGADGRVEPRVRRVTKIGVSDTTRDRIAAMFLARVDELASAFGVTIRECEAPQFLRYGEGDFFVAHQDGNTPLIRDATQRRRVSLVLFLSEPYEYEGGALTFHGPYPERYPLDVAAGTLVAFRSELTHEVTPLVRGERFTVVSWCF